MHSPRNGGNRRKVACGEVNDALVTRSVSRERSCAGVHDTLLQTQPSPLQVGHLGDEPGSNCIILDDIAREPCLGGRRNVLVGRREGDELLVCVAHNPRMLPVEVKQATYANALFGGKKGVSTHTFSQSVVILAKRRYPRKTQKSWRNANIPAKH